MARLTSSQWAEIKALYEVKVISEHELAKQFGISNTAIRKMAVKHGWIKNGSSHLVDMNHKVIKCLEEISSQNSTLSSQHIVVIADEVAFRCKSDEDLQAIQDVVNKLVKSVDIAPHALALMTATIKHREARLGKSPDVAIQINNSQEASTTTIGNSVLSAIERKYKS